MDGNSLDLRQLREPSAEFRGAPFWSWNGEMEEGRITAQLRSFYDAGMGGAFIHSRSGLKTPYMGEKWFSCVEAAVNTAVHAGKKVYLYDEDRYSSGFAGGEVCREHPEFRACHLTVATRPVPDGDLLAVFAVRRTAPGQVAEYRRLADEAQAAPGEEVLYFQVCDFVRNPQWHNDSNPTDLCNKEAVERFIELAYEPYAAAVGQYFGDTIPAVFTDEVCLTVLPSGKRTEDVLANHHWTRDYPRLFSERYGYDFRDYLPELFFEVESPKMPSLPKDYLQGLSDLFEENFSRRLGQWCAGHGLAFTGHLNFANFLDFTRVGNPMAQFRHWQWPGMDILTDQVAKLAAFKMTSSAAHQFGGRVICETYGCTGWDWPLERHRFQSGWQFCLGVDFRCHHLSHYSLAGWGKKDYPASIAHHSPWFEDYNQIEDHCGRLSYALTRGWYAARILVLSPYETVTGLYRGHHFGPTDPVKEKLEYLNEVWEKINRTLIEHHIDFDYGDEGQLCENGLCRDGKITLGAMEYDRVLVLPGHDPDPRTLAMLEEGGIAPTYLPENLPETLPEEWSDGLRITCGGSNAAQVWSTRRFDGEKTILFLQSMADERMEPEVTVSCAGPVLLMAEDDGSLIRIPAETLEGELRFRLTLEPGANALVLLGYEAEAEELPGPMPARTLELPADGYRYTLEEPNTLPLDQVQIAFGHGEWSEAMSVSEAEERIRSRYGLESMRFYESPQPWYIHQYCYRSFRELCRMRFVFRAAQVPEKCALVLEGYERFESVTLNGNPVPRPAGWLIDEDLQTASVEKLVQEGENVLEVRFRYGTDLELENMALAGIFGVGPIRSDEALNSNNVQLVALPETLTSGSWAENGLPFYTGRLTYHYEWTDDGTPCVLDLSRAKMLGCVVTHNGTRMARLCRPYKFDLTDTIKAGRNELQIQLIPGRKNILGPLHVERALIVEPDDFRFDSPFWQEDYQLHTYGLMP
jgi:hypothetical protein